MHFTPQTTTLQRFLRFNNDHHDVSPALLRCCSRVQVTEGEIDMVTLKKFVSYCRARCAPRLSAEAGQTLASEVSLLSPLLLPSPLSLTAPPFVQPPPICI